MIGKCFVIMGYGVKTDYATGRELDLDKTYKNIIKPAAEELNLKCIRADEIRHSGTIDVPMYRELIEADVVIADLSTSNPNAFYELGVRHVLRPRTTIAIAESNLKPPFDINHTVIHKYEHMGKDIGYEEVMRFRKELVETIKKVLKNGEIDSPIYTYLKGLTPPKIMDSEELHEINTDEKETLSNIIEKGKKALDNDDFIAAKVLFEHAKNIDENNDYIIQKLALATYKSKHPTIEKALLSALKTLKTLNINRTTDPETLGLAGAIYKRLWEEKQSIDFLNKSIFFYEKGFYLKNDYYNGINLAYLLDVSAVNQKDKNETITDLTLANRVRKKVIVICNNIIESPSYKDRNDKYWIAATVEEAYFGLGKEEKYIQAKKDAIALSNNNWERRTTEEQINKIIELRNMIT